MAHVCRKKMQGTTPPHISGIFLKKKIIPRCCPFFFGLLQDHPLGPRHCQQVNSIIINNIIITRLGSVTQGKCYLCLKRNHCKLLGYFCKARICLSPFLWIGFPIMLPLCFCRIHHPRLSLSELQDITKAPRSRFPFCTILRCIEMNWKLNNRRPTPIRNESKMRSRSFSHLGSEGTKSEFHF